MKRLVIFSILLSASICAMAQKPSIGFVYPGGACQGQTIEVTLGGQNIAKVDQAYISGEGIKAEVIIDNSSEGRQRNKISKKNIGDEDNLQIAQRIKVRLTIAENAPIGLRDLRVSSDKGISNRLFFEIGQFGNILEHEPNSEFAKANKVDHLPATLCGQIMMSDKDFWRFSARKGQTIVIDVKARILTPYIADAVPGWFQSIITLYDGNGKEVAYCDDYRYRVDPLILFTVPESGEYVLEIKDGLYRGREDFTYRIDIGEIPYITSIYPLGGNAGKTTKVNVNGVNLPQTNLSVAVPKKQHGKMDITMKNKGGVVSNAVRFDISPREFREIVRPQTDLPVAVDLDEVVNARFTKPCEQHIYKLSLDAPRTQLVVEIQARRAGAPTDAKIEIVRNGRIVAKNDDFEDNTEGLMTHFADPQVIYRAVAGEYTIRVTESQNHFGEEYDYRLYVMKRKPDFELTCEPGFISIPRGGSAVVTMSALRKYRFNGPIDTRFEGFPKGFDTSFSSMEKGDKKRPIVVTAPESAAEGMLSVKIFGSGEDPQTGERLTREAHPVETMTQAFAWEHDVPASDLQVKILPPQPFSLRIKSDKGPFLYHMGEEVPIEVEIIRRNGYSEPIQLMVRGAKSGKAMEAVPVTVGPDQKTAKIYVKFNWWGVNKVQSVIITGNVKGSSKKLKGQARNAFTAAVTAVAPAVAIRMPAEKSPLDPSLKKKKNTPKRQTKNGA